MKRPKQFTKDDKEYIYPPLLKAIEAREKYIDQLEEIIDL